MNRMPGILFVLLLVFCAPSLFAEATVELNPVPQTDDTVFVPVQTQPVIQPAQPVALVAAPVVVPVEEAVVRRFVHTFDPHLQLLQDMSLSGLFFLSLNGDFLFEQNLQNVQGASNAYKMLKSGVDFSLGALKSTALATFSDPIRINPLAKGAGALGFRWNDFSLALFSDMAADANATFPSWPFEMIFHDTLPDEVPALQTDSGVLFQSMASAGISGGYHGDWFSLNAHVETYTPILVIEGERVYQYDETSGEGTMTWDTTLYSAFQLWPFSWGAVPGTLFFDGVKAGAEVILGKGFPWVGFSVKDIAILPAQLQYQANWTLDGAFDTTPTSTWTVLGSGTPAWTQLATPVEWRPKPSFAGFVNIPVASFFTAQLHGSQSPLSGWDAGGMAQFHVGTFDLFADMTVRNLSFYLYTVGFGVNLPFGRVHLSAGVGSSALFQFNSLSAPRLNLGVSLRF